MSCVQVNCESQKQSPLADMAAIGPRLLSETLKGVGEFVRLAGETAPQFLPLAALRPRKVCEIPETECPPRCVCHVTWEACPGEIRVHHLRITNSSKRERDFAIKAIPFPDPAGPIHIQPDSMTLGPGKTGEARAIYAVPDRLASGTYETELLVAGAYEQCITVTLHVGGRQRCECHISQGEIPVRIRAHRWYDHFQCVEKCFEPVQLRKYEKEKR